MTEPDALRAAFLKMMECSMIGIDGVRVPLSAWYEAISDIQPKRDPRITAAMIAATRDSSDDPFVKP